MVVAACCKACKNKVVLVDQSVNGSSGFEAPSGVIISGEPENPELCLVPIGDIGLK